MATQSVAKISASTQARFGQRVTYTSTRDGRDYAAIVILQESVAMQALQGMVELRDMAVVDRADIPEPRQGDRITAIDSARVYIVDTFTSVDMGTRWRLSFRAALT